MKLGDVLAKERARKELGAAETAAKLGLTEAEYRLMESGTSPIEVWGPLLGRIAVQLELPTSRLLAESGKPGDAAQGQAGKLIARRREALRRSTEETANGLGLPLSDYQEIETGDSPLESIGLALLRFGELVELPLFNLLYPHGLALDQLDDYP